MSKDKKAKVEIIIDYTKKVAEFAVEKNIDLKPSVDILKNLLALTFENYRRNKIDEKYFVGLQDAGISKEEVLMALTKIRNEIKNQEMYLEYLMKRINEMEEVS